MRRSTVAVVGHIGPSARGEKMTSRHALAALAALGQPVRLDVFQLLMRLEPKGMPAGMIAEKIGCSANTLSTHLAILARCGLVRGRRDGKSIIYRANVEGLKALISYLVNDCCSGHPELCQLGEILGKSRSCVPPRANVRRQRRGVG